MLNFSFGELLVVGIVGLIVLGPEQMPKMAKKLGNWMAQVNHFTSSIKMEMSDQLKLKELKDNTSRAEAADQDYHVQ